MASCVGVLIGGALADFWSRATPRGRIYVSALGTASCVPALIGLSHASTLETAIVFMIIFGLGFGLFDANNMPILCQVVPPQYRATGYGFMNLMGIGIGGVVTRVMDQMRDHDISLSLAFGISAGVAAFASILILFVRPRPYSQRNSPSN